MANEVSRKVVVIRRKAVAPKQQVVEAAPVDLMAGLQKQGITGKQRTRRKRQSELWRKAHPGLRYVQFVIEIELWDRFVAACCSAQKPNTVFTHMIREAVVLSEEHPLATSP